MKIFILSALISIFLVSCQGINTTQGFDWNNTATPGINETVINSTVKIHKVIENEKHGDNTEAHLLRQILFPSDIHEDIKEPGFIGDLNGRVDNKTVKSPKNVILVMFEGEMNDDQWFKFKENCTFFMKNILQKCTKREIFIGNNSVHEDDFGVGCHWKKNLMESINELVHWARLNEQMNIGTVSVGNFTLPSMFPFEKPSSFYPPKILNEQKEKSHNSSESALKFRNSTINQNQSALRIPLAFDPHSAERDLTDEPWDFLDFITKIRFAIFKTFMESLHDAFGKREDEIQSPVGYNGEFPNIMNLVENTLEDLQWTSTDNGYLLIIVAPIKELWNISHYLGEKTSLNDTLVILTGLNEDNRTGLPLYSAGPGSPIINATHTLCDIPAAIKTTLGYRSAIHKDQFPLSLNGAPRKRNVHTDDEDDMSFVQRSDIIPKPEPVDEVNSEETASETRAR